MLKFLIQIFFVPLVEFSALLAGEGLSNANDYQKNSSLQWKWANESLETFPFEKNDKVLDLGCGTGSITAEIANRVPFGVVIGLDISESVLAYAREHYQCSNIIYMEGDAKKLPFIEQFDKVIALLSLNWINEQEKALTSIYKALKVNGKALITRPGKQPSNLGSVTECLVKTDRWISYFPNFEQKKRYYNLEEYKHLLESAGFFVEKISQDSTYTYFSNKDALVGFYYPLCIFLDHLSIALKQQFVEEIVDKILETHQIMADGSILLHDFKLEAIVSKPDH